MEKIKLVFLGTSDAIPSKERNHTAILLNYKEENILFDCGEGTQRQFRKADLNPCKITRIFITHWHGDHVLGLPGLFQTLAFSKYGKKLEIYGPIGTKKYVNEMMTSFNFVNTFPIEVTEILSAGKLLDGKDWYVEAEKMLHGAPTLAYNFVKKGTLRIDKQKLKKYKIKPGPLLGKLKDGKNIVYEGKKYKFKDLTYEEDAKKISIVLDTGKNDKIVGFVKDADLLISESTYGEELEERAKKYKHLTSKQAGEIAKKAKVKKLIITHLSQRYEFKKEQILKEAKRIFPHVELAKDFLSLEI